MDPTAWVPLTNADQTTANAETSIEMTLTLQYGSISQEKQLSVFWHFDYI